MIGIIYLRISPSGKCYVGQTTNEYKRNWLWMNSKCYSGKHSVVDNARNKYKPENFKYKVLFKLQSNDRLFINKTLNELEIEYIITYRSHVSNKTGYNVTKGGHHRLEKLPDEHKNNISKALKGKIPKNLNSIQQSEKTKQANRNRGISVIVQSLDGLFIKEYSSTNSACIDLNLDRGWASKVINNKLKSIKGYTIKLKNND